MTDTIGYTLDRVFDAPRELVYSMFTTPEHFAVWWGGDTVEVVDVEMDPRTDGNWKATMVGPDKAWSINWIGEFREVDEPDHLVMAFTDDPSNPARDWYDIAFTDVDGGTRVVLSQVGGNLTAEQYEQAGAGTNHFLDTMQAYLARLK